jgi:hypothetical protein
MFKGQKRALESHTRCFPPICAESTSKTTLFCSYATNFLRKRIAFVRTRRHSGRTQCFSAVHDKKSSSAAGMPSAFPEAANDRKLQRPAGKPILSGFMKAFGIAASIYSHLLKPAPTASGANQSTPLKEVVI